MRTLHVLFYFRRHCVSATQRNMDLKTEPTILMKLQFSIRYHTKFGESLWLSGNIEPLGAGNPSKAIPLEYLNDQFWHITLEIDKKYLQKNTVCYKYYLRDQNGEWIGGDPVAGFGRMDVGKHAQYQIAVCRA